MRHIIIDFELLLRLMIDKSHRNNYQQKRKKLKVTWQKQRQTSQGQKKRVRWWKWTEITLNGNLKKKGVMQCFLYNRELYDLDYEHGIHIFTVYRLTRLTQCCTQFKSLGVKVLCVLHLHDNIASTFKWYGNTWNNTFYSQRIGIGYNIELAKAVYRQWIIMSSMNLYQDTFNNGLFCGMYCRVFAIHKAAFVSLRLDPKQS